MNPPQQSGTGTPVPSLTPRTDAACFNHPKDWEATAVRICETSMNLERELGELKAQLRSERGTENGSALTISDLTETLQEMSAKLQAKEHELADAVPVTEYRKLRESFDDALLKFGKDLLSKEQQIAVRDATIAGLMEALKEIHSEGVGALNNAFPEDAPEIVESMAQKAERALANEDLIEFRAQVPPPKPDAQRHPIGEVCEHNYPKAYWCQKCHRPYGDSPEGHDEAMIADEAADAMRNLPLVEPDAGQARADGET